MKYRRWFASGFAFVFLCCAGSAGAQTPARPPLQLTLAEAVTRALADNPEIRQVQAGVEAAAAKKDQADAGRFPQINFTAVLGPSSRARGTILDSPDSTKKPVVNNVFTREDLQLIQPLYTFGKLSGLREAADQGIRVEQARVGEKQGDVALQVKEAYYGLLLARELQGLLADIQGQLEKALDKVDRQLAAGAPGIDEVDRYKLRAFAGQLKKKQSEVEQGRALALSGLRTLLNLPSDQAIEPAATLAPDLRVPGPEAAQVGDALRLRPEMAQAEAGLRARQALVEVERSNYYPQFFFAVIGAFARAGNRSDQSNPFVTDPLSTEWIAPVVGLKLDLDFGITAGKVRGAVAEYQKVQEARTFAERGIPFQVRKALAELSEAHRSIAATEEGYTSAKQWLVAADANFDLGVGEAKEVADALVAFAQLRADNYRAIYNVNLAWANLDHATGRDTQEGR